MSTSCCATERRAHALDLPAHDPRVIFQRNNARWHTDSSYRFVPSLASILYGIEVLPDGAAGGETGFSNMFLAYEALPEDMKRRLEPLHMVHNYEGIRRLEPEMPPTSAGERDAFPPVSHPVIRVHPDRDGRRSLYFTCNTAREIGGGTLEEGQALHEWLREHVSQPRFCYYHRWRPRDLVMWDNRCLLHRAIPYDYEQHRRVLRRTTVAGSGPVVGPSRGPWHDRRLGSAARRSAAAAEASHAPGFLYASADVYRLEVERLFMRDGSTSRVSRSCPSRRLHDAAHRGEPLVIRARSGGHAARLLQCASTAVSRSRRAEATPRRFKCPYHGGSTTSRAATGAAYMRRARGFALGVSGCSRFAFRRGAATCS